MAKAVFTKGQRVFVKSVGAWAVVEKILPQWVRGVEEPIKVLYDVGLGREFQASELIAEARDDKGARVEIERWRLVRMHNRNVHESADARHPFPGTFPVVCTEEIDWGGWRVPTAEYERDPDRIEFQARLIAAAPRMLAVVKALAASAEAPGAPPPPPEYAGAVNDAIAVLRHVYEPIRSAPANASPPSL